MKIVSKTRYINAPTCIVRLRDVKPEIRKQLKTRGLYALESIFRRECEGHGYGFADNVEDIGFRFQKPNIYFNISLTRNGLGFNELYILTNHKGEEVNEVPGKISPELVKFIKQRITA